MQIKYSLILPCYNELENLKLLIPQLLGKLKNKDFEIVIVDDNSQDQTIKNIKKKYYKNKRIKYILRKKKPSLGFSIKDGLLKSRGQSIIVMDTDFNHRPSDLKRMLLIYEKNEYDIISGSRFLKGGYSSSNFRHYSSLFFNFFINFIINGKLTDNFSGFFIIKKKLIINELNNIFYGYGEYYIRLLFYLQKNRMAIKEISVKYGKRKYGVSKSKLIKMMFTYTYHAIKLLI